MKLSEHQSVSNEEDGNWVDVIPSRIVEAEMANVKVFFPIRDHFIHCSKHENVESGGEKEAALYQRSQQPLAAGNRDGHQLTRTDK